MKLDKRGIGTRLLNSIGLAPIRQFSQEFEELRGSLNNPNVPLSQVTLDFFGGQESEAGVNVNQDVALTLSAVYRANKILCDTIASVPVNVFEKTSNGKEVAIEHDAQFLIHSEPNPIHTSFSWREMMQGNYNFFGNALSFIHRNGRGVPVYLEPIRNEQIKNIRKNRFDIWFEIELEGQDRWVSNLDIVNIANFSKDGVTGIGALEAARQNIGSGIAQRDYGARFFKNDATSGLILINKITKSMSKQQKEDNISEWQRFRTKSNQHGSAVLTGEWDVKNITIPPDQAQFIQTQNLTVVDVGRFFGVQPHLLFNLERSTFNNIEHQSIEFVTHTILGIVKKWENELNRKLFTPSERKEGKYFVKFNLNGLLQADVKSRAEFYRTGIQNGFISPNEVRGLEDMDKIKDWDDAQGPGERYFIQQNMMGLDQVTEVVGNKEGNGEESNSRQTGS